MKRKHRFRAELREPALVLPIESPTAAMDGIDVNDAHVRRLVQGLGAGEPVAAELVALGPAAVGALVQAGAEGRTPLRRQAANILSEMGVDVVPALFEASERVGGSRLFGRGEGADRLVVEVNMLKVDAQRMGQLVLKKGMYGAGESLATNLSKETLKKMNPKMNMCKLKRQTTIITMKVLSKVHRRT